MSVFEVKNLCKSFGNTKVLKGIGWFPLEKRVKSTDKDDVILLQILIFRAFGCGIDVGCSLVVAGSTG